MAKIKPSTRKRTKRDDDRLAKLRAFVETLPEAVIDGDRHKKLTVRKKSFAFYCDDHHGDGVVGVWFRSTPEARDAFVASDPVHFFVPPYVGVRGWVAYRVDLPTLDWDLLNELLMEAYRIQAPKRLREQLDQPRSK